MLIVITTHMLAKMRTINTNMWYRIPNLPPIPETHYNPLTLIHEFSYVTSMRISSINTTHRLSAEYTSD